MSTGSALTNAMQSTGVFPTMVLQMASIGEESGSLDHMLGKAAEFYEDEVDEMVKGLSSLMEPFIIVILGTLIGGIVVSNVPADLQARLGCLGKCWPTCRSTCCCPPWALALVACASAASQRGDPTGCR